MRQGQRQRQGPFAHCFLGVSGQSPLSTVSADDWVSFNVIIIRCVVIYNRYYEDSIVFVYKRKDTRVVKYYVVSRTVSSLDE